MLTALTSGMSPVSNLFDAFSQVAFMSLFRFISLFYLNDFWRIIASFQQNGKKTKDGKEVDNKEKGNGTDSPTSSGDSTSRSDDKDDSKKNKTNGKK